MSTQNEAERLARAWIEGWNKGKPEEIPLARDFVHTSPFGVTKGRDEYLAKTKPMAAKNVTSLEIVKVLSGEGESAIWFRMVTPNGLVQVCDWVQIQNEHIVAINSFYDPTSLPYREGHS